MAAYTVYIDGDAEVTFYGDCAANGKCRDYIQGLMNDGGFTLDQFKVTKDNQTLIVDGRWEISIGGM